MRIAITGSSGLIGSAVSKYFRDRGCAITRVCHVLPKDDTNDTIVLWDIPSRRIDREGLEGHDYVIHLAGANIAARRWTPSYKKEILKSRVDGTGLLCETLAGLKDPPKAVFSASAVGFYGPRASGDRVDETNASGSDFLSDVCGQWERAAGPAVAAGLRVIHMRFGVVLSAHGGALAKMMPLFKIGCGGPIGSGKQMMSWIALAEIPRIIRHLINHEDICGPVNFSAPEAVSNARFTRVLGKVLGRPAGVHIPAFVIRLRFGKMGEALLLSGQNVFPLKLVESGYVFKYFDLEETLRASFAR